MRIGIYVGSLNARAGGAFTFQRVILNELNRNKRNHTFYLFCDDSVVESDYANLKVITRQPCDIKATHSAWKKIYHHYFYTNQQYVASNYYQNYLQRLLYEKKIDLLWFLTPETYHFDVPYIFTVWDLQHRLQPYFPEVSFAANGFSERERLYSSLLPRATYIVVGNEAGKEEIERFYGVPSWRIKINPMPTPQFVFDKTIISSNNLNKFNIKKPYLFYPAQFWPHKNHIVILYAIKILKEKYGQSFDVVFAGSDKGNMPYIKEVVSLLGHQQNVHFVGFVDLAFLVDLYKNAFALVYASFFGPDNIPPLEAFGLECPVLAARVSGAQYQLEGAALLFNPSSEGELVEQILQLQNNHDEKKNRLNEGLKRAYQYSSKYYIENMIKTFDEFESIRRCWSSYVPYKSI
jgi:glycosyltransferase involved in cell wall biosynthesis